MARKSFTNIWTLWTMKNSQIIKGEFLIHYITWFMYNSEFFGGENIDKMKSFPATLISLFVFNKLLVPKPRISLRTSSPWQPTCHLKGPRLTPVPWRKWVYSEVKLDWAFPVRLKPWLIQHITNLLIEKEEKKLLILKSVNHILIFKITTFHLWEYVFLDISDSPYYQVNYTMSTTFFIVFCIFGCLFIRHLQKFEIFHEYQELGTTLWGINADIS